jgi:hypothetical protein
MINERRRADSKIGTTGQIPVLFDGRASIPRTPKRRCPKATSASAHHKGRNMTNRIACRVSRAAAASRPLLGFALLGALPAARADVVNAYSIWPENWARPMFEEFEKATGIKVNFVRFSSGEALARVIAEKGNPRVDVLFGGPSRRSPPASAKACSNRTSRRRTPRCRRASSTPTASGSRSPTIRSCS